MSFSPHFYSLLRRQRIYSSLKIWIGHSAVVKIAAFKLHYHAPLPWPPLPPKNLPLKSKWICAMISYRNSTLRHFTDQVCVGSALSGDWTLILFTGGCPKIRLSLWARALKIVITMLTQWHAERSLLLSTESLLYEWSLDEFWYSYKKMFCNIQNSISTLVCVTNSRVVVIFFCRSYTRFPVSCSNVREIVLE